MPLEIMDSMFLVTEVQDKLAEAIRMLQDYGEIESDLTLREVYNKYFHPNVLPIEEDKYWKALQENSVLNIFQFDSDVGSQAAKKIKPTNILEMADANRVNEIDDRRKRSRNSNGKIH